MSWTSIATIRMSYVIIKTVHSKHLENMYNEL